MIRRLRQTISVALVVGFACAQSSDSGFVAVSIKSASRGSAGQVVFHPGGRLTANGVVARQLIDAAYGFTQNSPRLAAGPDWIVDDLFNVEAVAAQGDIPGNLAPAQLRKRMQIMLRQMLAERFKLVVRVESTEIAVFQLTVHPSGAKLTKSSLSEDECEMPDAPNICHQLQGDTIRGLQGAAVDLTDIVSQLERTSNRPILDATGIHGLYSIKVGPISRVTPPDLDPRLESLGVKPPPDVRPNVFKVLEQEFGLRLVPTKARVEVLKIESIERPSSN